VAGVGAVCGGLVTFATCKPIVSLGNCAHTHYACCMHALLCTLSQFSRISLSAGTLVLLVVCVLLQNV
jgi:hypothetical protein